MARPRTPIGTFGEISFRQRESGRIVARARFRDWDGKLRTVQATADTRITAEHLLKAKLNERALIQPDVTTITPDSTFAALVDYWVEDLALETHLAPRTRESYEWVMRKVVEPSFKDLSLREIGVARCDRFLRQLAVTSFSRARKARSVMRLAFGLAVRHEILPTSPMDHVSRLRRPPSNPTALSPAAINAVRAAITHWEKGQSGSGPKPDGQLGQIVEVILGTSARIGEVLAIRRCDVDVTTSPASLRISGTIIQLTGKPVARQDHPKSSKSVRTIALPSFAAEAIRKRLTAGSNRHADSLLFCSRNGTPLTTHNVRRQLRRAVAPIGIEGVTPHMLRRSVATAIDRGSNVELAAELLGHSDTKVTIQHYIRRNEIVNPLTATLLEEAFAREGAGEGSD